MISLWLPMTFKQAGDWKGSPCSLQRYFWSPFLEIHVMGKEAHTGVLNGSLWLQKTQNCTQLTPGLSHCSLMVFASQVISGKHFSKHRSTCWTSASGGHSFHMSISCLLRFMLKLKAAEPQPQVSDCVFLNVTVFWQLRQYCVNAHRCFMLTLTPLCHNPQSCLYHLLPYSPGVLQTAMLLPLVAAYQEITQ